MLIMITSAISITSLHCVVSTNITVDLVPVFNLLISVKQFKCSTQLFMFSYIC